MQILNISVMNRPAKSLTSCMYVNYVPDAVQHSMDVRYSTIRDVVNLYSFKSPVQVSLAVTDASIRDVVFRIDGGFSEVQQVLSLRDSTIADTMQRFNAGKDGFSHVFNMRDSTINNVLLKYTMEPHGFSNTFSIRDSTLE